MPSGKTQMDVMKLTLEHLGPVLFQSRKKKKEKRKRLARVERPQELACTCKEKFGDVGSSGFTR